MDTPVHMCGCLLSGVMPLRIAMWYCGEYPKPIAISLDLVFELTPYTVLNHLYDRPAFLRNPLMNSPLGITIFIRPPPTY
jgi:hypothetical protein